MENFAAALEGLSPENPPYIRILSAQDLAGNVDPSVLDGLRRVLDAQDAGVRLAVAQALSESAANLAVAAAGAVEDHPELHRADRTALLSRLLEAVLPVVERTMYRDDPMAQCHAAGILASLPVEEARAVLHEHLEGPDPGIAVLAAAALARRRAPEAIQHLIETLEDADEAESLRLIAASALVPASRDDAREALTLALEDSELIDAWYRSQPVVLASLIDVAVTSSHRGLRAAAEAAKSRTYVPVDAEGDMNQDVDRLLDQLLGRDSDTRAAAADALTGLDADAVVHRVVEAVGSAADDPAAVLDDVPRVLASFPGAESVELLIALAQHREWPHRMRAVQALGQLGDPAGSGIVLDRLVADAEFRVRKVAAIAAASLPPTSGATRALVHAVLRDSALPDTWVSRSAGATLRQLALTSAIPELVAGLGATNPSGTKRSAAWALGELRATAATTPLRALVRDTQQTEEVQRAAIWALGTMRTHTADGELTGALRSQHWSVRAEAAWALGNIKVLSAVDDLRAVTRDSVPEVVERALWALGEIGDGSACDDVVTALTRMASAAVRARAAWALGQIGLAKAGGPLLSALRREPSPVVREAIVHALGELRHRKARADLETLAIDDRNFRVQKAALQVLGVVGTAATLDILDLVLQSASDPHVLDAAQGAVERLRRDL